LFFSEKLACGACHAVGSEGGQLGPDLTTIGVIRSPYDLLEAVVFPNASFVPGYEPYRIEAADDQLGTTQIYEGVIGHETADAITLRTAAREEIRILRASITSMSQSRVSIMPEGLDTGMTQQELLDLMAFLQSLNNEQWLQPERREVARK
jgi:putative heme-binding domain-containing protein